MKKRIISLLLCLCMVFSLLPTAVLAADGEDSDNTTAGSGQVTQQDSEKSDDTEGQDTPTDPEQEEPVQGPTAEEQLAEMIEKLPDPSEIDPLDEKQVEAIHNQISAIYDFAEANDLGDRENGLLDEAANATVNTVIAAAWPAETLESPTTEGGMTGTSGGVDWKYENGVLTISAAESPENDYSKGKMKDYTDQSKETMEISTPWYGVKDDITEVVIQNDVTYLGDWAFSYLTNAQKANIPASITDLGDHIFRGDTNLTAVEWADGFQAPNITDTDSVSGNYAGTYVPTSMFDGCTSLGGGQELSDWLPDSFTGVGCAAFRGTKFTVNFDAWSKLNYIGAYAFSEMPNLDSFTLTDSIIIGLRYDMSNAFAKSGLKSLTVDAETVPSRFAFSAQNLAEIVLTDKVTNINAGAFQGTAITELVIPSGVEKLGTWSFLNCSSLKKLTLLGEITLEGVQFPGTSLEELVIDKDAVVTCTDDPFRATGDYPAMTSLKKASILGTFTSSSADTDTKTFWRCFSRNADLTEVVLSGKNADNFSGTAFPNVTTLSILRGDAKLPGYILGGDSKLEQVTIDVDNYSSESGSFRYAKCLKTFRLKADSATLDNRAFVECPSLVAVDLTECSSITYGDNTFSAMTTTGQNNEPTSHIATIYVNSTSADPKGADNKAGLSDSHGIVAITNGGTFPADTVFETGKLAKPKKDGCLFLGWYEDPAYNGEKVTAGEAGKIYYAKWMDHIPEPTDADFTDGLVTVQCLSPVPHNDVRYGLNAAVATDKYVTERVSATEYSVTYEADAFAVNGHSLYSADTLNWTLTYDGSKWNLAPKNPGVDDVVLVTHAPTTFDEVTKFIDGRTDVIHTSCVNGETATCAYGLMVAFQNPDHVVSVEQEKDSSSGKPIRGSYIATLKMDQFAAACAKACNGKSFADSPRTHDVRSQNPVQWRFKVTPAEVGTDTGAEKQYVWSAEPVEADKDDVCQVAHRVVLTFSYHQHDVMVDDTKVEYKYNTTEITNNVEVPTPTREGYTFIRWLDADGNAFDPTANVTEDHTYDNIEWKPINYRVIFNANAGGKTVTGTMGDQVFTYDQPQTLSANQFVCTDSVFDERLKQNTQLYEFGGWNTEADGSGTAYTDGQEVINLTAESDGEITLYAQWKHVTKTLTYVSAYGTAPSAADVDIFSEVVVAGAPAGFDETKYIFKGWRSDIDGLRENLNPTDKFVMPNTDVTLTAVWEEIVPAVKHNVTYQNENLTYAGDEHEVGSIVKVERPDPPRTGYTFTGWRSSHEGRIYQRGDTFVMPDTDVTLTAQWQKNPTEYTVMFMDGNRNVGSQKGVAGSLVLLMEALNKEGYSFVGWKSNVDGKVYEASTRYTMPELNVKMIAVWQADPATYTVTYALNGGEGAALDSNAYVEGAFVTVTDAAVTKDGFVFAGWRADVGGDVYQAGDKFQMPASNVVLTAQWQPEEATYTVSTSIDGAVTQIAAGKKANEIYTITVDDPTKDSHTFTGWLLSSTGTIVHNGDTFNMPAGNVVLTAQWEKEADSYSVTYVDGNWSEVKGSYKAGETVTVLAPAPAPEGYTFKYWRSSNEGKTYQPGDTFPMPATNVILTAIWDSETYTITWKNGDTILAKTNVKRGETPEYIGETPTKGATAEFTYTFSGWTPDPTAATADTTYEANFTQTKRSYTVKFYNADGTLLESKQVEYGTVPKLGRTPTLEGNSQYSYTFKTWSPKLAPVTGDAEYYATYTRTVNTYTVTWVIDGMSETQTYEYGKMPAHADPVKPATDDAVYTFESWTPALSIVTGNVTYTAQFTETAKHTVSYDLNGGTPAVASAKYTEGEAVNTPADVPTKTGYVFTGWLISFENKTVNANGTFSMPNTDVTLTAQWRVAITSNVYIPAIDPVHGVHEKAYNAQLTAKKDNATGDPVAAGDVQFVLVDEDGHADTSRNIGHGLTLNADGSITGTANGAGEVTFRVKLANADGDFVSDEIFVFTIVIEKAPRTCTVTIADWIYGDKASDPAVTLSKTEVPETYTYFYKVKGALDDTYTTTVPVDAGEYTLKAVVGESANYLGCEATADFKILKKEIKSVSLSVTAPVACAAAQTTIADGDGFTGTITWTPAPVDGKFNYATEYTATVVLTPDSNHYFTARTTAEGWSVSYDATSGNLTLTHKFEKTELGKIETPVIHPNGGRFTGRQTVKITCATEGANIYYTLDGTTPTVKSTLYTNAFKITESTTVKAIAVKANYIDSAVATAEFTKRTGGNGGGGSGTVVTPVKPSKKDDSLRFNTEDHFAFVNGYPDGTVKPTGDVTRAEVAAILYRVMDADCVKTYETTRCSFSDVVRGDWFNLYVATLENADVIVDTRTNGKFRPNEAITRAELAAMLAQFADIKSAANSFNDVSARHWASDEIAVCAKMGWINGYPDGSFRPDATITRAEMMAMINRALGRTPKSADDLLSGMKTWRDNANVNAWYYLDVQEATNSHTYTKSGSHETWKKLR